MITEISDIENYSVLKTSSEAALFYFSHEDCNVCKVLKPKIENLLSSQFPEFKMYFINTIKNPEITGQERIFTVPSIIVCFDGNEFIRKSRNIGLAELENELSRPYNIYFS